jgi:tol-pal system protein YbgF
MIFYKTLKTIFILLLFSSLLYSCGGKLPGADARKVPTNPADRVKKNMEEGRGFRLMDKVSTGGSRNFEFASSNELWRASLDTIDFMPLSSVNYSGGIIITDWYSTDNNNESINLAKDSTSRLSKPFLILVPPPAAPPLKEFITTHKEHDLAGNAQYWYGETFRIRQLYSDAATAYLDGYQNYPKSKKAPENLLKLGITMVQLGEKDEGCSMIEGIKKQYPKANKSVLQKAQYEQKKFKCGKS